MTTKHHLYTTILLEAHWKTPTHTMIIHRSFPVSSPYLDELAKKKSRTQTPAPYPCRYWLPARSYVKTALESRFSVDPSGSIILLSRVCPWKEHLYQLEEEMKITAPGEWTHGHMVGVLAHR